MSFGRICTHPAWNFESSLSRSKPRKRLDDARIRNSKAGIECFDVGLLSRRSQGENRIANYARMIEQSRFYVDKKPWIKK